MSWEVVWQVPWKDHVSVNKFATKRGAINFGNRLSRQNGWGSFCIRHHKPSPPDTTDHFTGVCE